MTERRNDKNTIIRRRAAKTRKQREEAAARENAEVADKLRRLREDFYTREAARNRPAA